MSTQELIDAIQSGDSVKIQSSFESAMASKIAEKIDVMRQQVAQNMFKESVEELDEVTYSAKKARAGEDIGKPGKEFEKITASAAERYGSEEAGKRVAGAILAKLRKK